MSYSKSIKRENDVLFKIQQEIERAKSYSKSSNRENEDLFKIQQESERESEGCIQNPATERTMSYSKSSKRERARGMADADIDFFNSLGVEEEEVPHQQRPQALNEEYQDEQKTTTVHDSPADARGETEGTHSRRTRAHGGREGNADEEEEARRGRQTTQETDDGRRKRGNNNIGGGENVHVNGIRETHAGEQIKITEGGLGQEEKKEEEEEGQEKGVVREDVSAVRGGGAPKSDAMKNAGIFAGNGQAEDIDFFENLGGDEQQHGSTPPVPMVDTRMPTAAAAAAAPAVPKLNGEHHSSHVHHQQQHHRAAPAGAGDAGFPGYESSQLSNGHGKPHVHAVEAQHESTAWQSGDAAQWMPQKDVGAESVTQPAVFEPHMQQHQLHRHQQEQSVSQHQMHATMLQAAATSVSPPVPQFFQPGVVETPQPVPVPVPVPVRTAVDESAQGMQHQQQAVPTMMQPQPVPTIMQPQPVPLQPQPQPHMMNGHHTYEYQQQQYAAPQHIFQPSMPDMPRASSTHELSSGNLVGHMPASAPCTPTAYRHEQQQQQQQHFFQPQQQHQQPVMQHHQQQQQQQQQRNAYSPDGRPPCAVPVFGFGSLLVVRNTSAASMGGSPVVEDFALSDILRRGSHGAAAFSGNALASLQCQHIMEWDSPMVGSMSAKNAGKLIESRIATADADEQVSGGAAAHGGAGTSKRVLWKLMLALTKTNGNLMGQGAGSGSGGGLFGGRKAPAHSDICEALDIPPAAAAAQAMEAAVAAPPHTSPLGPAVPEETQRVGALAMQRLLQEGRRQEAVDVATKHGLWALAMAVAQTMGPDAVRAVVSEMTAVTLVPGSPMHTLQMVFAGNMKNVLEEPTSDGNGKTTAGSGGTPMASHAWRENLAILANNQVSGSDHIATRLGDVVASRGDVYASHACYIVSSVPLTVFSPSSRMCLVGADHRRHVRTYTDPSALQLSEAYEYCRSLFQSQHVFVELQPYKLQYATMLAELGLVHAATKYCESVQRQLRLARPSEYVERIRCMAAAMEERMRTASTGTPIRGANGDQKSSILGGIGGGLASLVDKGVSMVLGDTQAQGVQQQSQQQLGPPAPSPSGPVVMNGAPPPSVVPASGPMPQPQVPQAQQQQQHQRPHSSPNSVAESTPPSSVSSSSGGMLRSLSTAALGIFRRTSVEAKLGEENKFFYDEKLGIWRVEGEEIPEEAKPPPPPPIVAPAAAAPPPPATAAAVGGALPGTAPPLPGASHQTRQRAGVRSRYVDTFATSAAALPTPAGAAGGGGGGAGVAPPPPQPQGGGGAFFVPSPAAAGGGAGAVPLPSDVAKQSQQQPMPVPMVPTIPGMPQRQQTAAPMIPMIPGQPPQQQG